MGHPIREKGSWSVADVFIQYTSDDGCTYIHSSCAYT